VISGYEGSKPRQVLITEADLPRVLDETGMRERRPASSSLESTPARSAATIND
jgi:hypothetical protein